MSLINDLKRFTVVNNFFYGTKEDSEGEFVLFEQAKNLYNIKCLEVRNVKEDLINTQKRLSTITNEKIALQNTLAKERKDFERTLAAKEIVNKMLVTFCAFLTVIFIFQQVVKILERLV